MKKSILIGCAVLTTMGLTAFGYENWGHAADDEKEAPCCSTTDLKPNCVHASVQPLVTNFLYEVDSRFTATITKDELQNAISVIDIVPREANWWSFPIQTVEISVFPDNAGAGETGDHVVLNEAQAELLGSLGYSDDFSITASCKGMHESTGELEYYDLYYVITIIPEKEAVYEDGQYALIEYLTENSKEQTADVREGQLKPGKIRFTVTTEGSISNVGLESTSGYPAIDDTMMELITNTPGKWEPAENLNGEKVDQELIFFFGKAGC